MIPTFAFNSNQTKSYVCYLCQYSFFYITSTMSVMKYDMKDKLEWTVIFILEFGRKYGLTMKQAFNYLSRFKGIDFIDRHYVMIMSTHNRSPLWSTILQHIATAKVGHCRKSFGNHHFSRPYFSLHHSCQAFTRFCHTT